MVEKVDKGSVHGDFEDQGEDVGPPQAPALLTSVLVETVAVFAIFLPVFPLPLLPVGDVHPHQERRASDEDELQCPQPDVGNGEEVVEADVVASRLNRVAFEVFLLVAPHLLRRHYKHHDPEEENNGEPHSAKGGGVLVRPTEQALEKCPVHDEVCSPPTLPVDRRQEKLS